MRTNRQINPNARIFVEQIYIDSITGLEIPTENYNIPESAIQKGKNLILKNQPRFENYPDIIFEHYGKKYKAFQTGFMG